MSDEERLESFKFLFDVSSRVLSRSKIAHRNMVALLAQEYQNIGVQPDEGSLVELEDVFRSLRAAVEDLNWARKVFEVEFAGTVGIDKGHGE